MVILLTITILFAAGCSNPIDITAEVEKLVKDAQNLYLKVLSVSPEDSATNINPGREIEIKFDRDIDISTVTAQSISIADLNGAAAGWEIKGYNSDTRVLTIEPLGILESLTSYNVSIIGVRGSRQEELMDPFVITFTTGDLPAGSISVFESVSAHSQTGYTDTADTFVSLTGNDAVDQYAVATYPVLIDGAPNPSLPLGSWKDPAVQPPDNLSHTLDLGLGDGLHTVYVAFRKQESGGGYSYSFQETDTIFLDRDAPQFTAALSDEITNTAVTVTPQYQDGNGTKESGIARFAWTASSDQVSFGSPASAQTSMSATPASGVNTYTCTLEMTDRAGNSASDSLTLTWDRDAPSAPSLSLINAGDVITAPQTLTWSWSSGGGGGNGNFEVSYNGGSYVGDDSPKSVTLTSRSTSRTYSLRVRERDDAGNWSSSAYESTDYFPAAALTPAYDAPSVSRTTSLDWADFYGAYTYDVFIWPSGTTKPRSPQFADLTSSAVVNKGSWTLASSTTYIWCYVVWGKRGAVLAVSPEWSFTTGTK
jgi:hypothetical protein